MSKIHESAINTLHPTHLTVGMIEVQDKKSHLVSLDPQDQHDFMQGILCPP